MGSREKLSALRRTHRSAVEGGLWLRVDAEWTVGAWAGRRHVLAIPAEEVSLASLKEPSTARVVDARWLPREEATEGRLERYERWASDRDTNI